MKKSPLFYYTNLKLLRRISRISAESDTAIINQSKLETNILTHSFLFSACFGPILATIFRLTKNEGNNGLYDLLELPHHITGTVQNSFTGIVRSLETMAHLGK